MAATAVFRMADKDETGNDKDKGPLPVITRERSPFPGLTPGSPEAKQMKQAKAAAKTLAEQEERQAREENREPKPTPTAEELYASVKPKDGQAPLGEVPAQNGVRINGVYVPTLEEIQRAGYSDPEALRAQILKQAEAAAPPAPENPPGPAAGPAQVTAPPAATDQQPPANALKPGDDTIAE